MKIIHLALLVVIGSLLSACGMGQIPQSTLTPTATMTFTPTATLPPSPTSTPKPSIELNADGTGDYPDLPSAIQAARAGDSIFMEEGMYILNEPLIIEKAITLVGEGVEKTIVSSLAEGEVLKFNGKGPFTLKHISFKSGNEEIADGVVVESGDIDFQNCSFNGGAMADEMNGGSGLVLGPGIINGAITGCNMDGNKNAGIRLFGESHPLLENNSCSKNRIGIWYAENSAGTARKNRCISNLQIGIANTGETKSILEENVCSGNGIAGIGFAEKSIGTAHKNQCRENTQFGIMIINTAQPILVENDCSKNGESGISYHNKSSGISRNNQAYEHKVAGIAVSGESNPTLEGNVCSKNEFGIVYRGDTGGTARKNECFENSNVGIGVAQNAQPVLEENIVTKNNMAGIAYVGGAAGIARNNQCVENSVFGIVIRESAKPTLENNNCPIEQ